MFMSRKFENFVCSPWIDTLSNLNNTLSNLNNPDLKKALECLCLESSRTFIVSCLLPVNWHFIKLKQETFEGNPIVGVSGQKWNDKFFVPEIVDNCLVTFTDEISQKWWWIVKSFQNPHLACVEYVVELVDLKVQPKINCYWVCATFHFRLSEMVRMCRKQIICPPF